MTDWEPRLEDDDRRPSRRRKSGRGAASLLVGVILVLVVVAAGLAIMFFTGAISTAQPTAQTATVPTPTLRPAVTQAPAATDTAAPTGGQQAADKPVVVKQTTYGDWIYACVKRPSSDGPPICTITQTLSEAKTKLPLFIWRIQRGDKGLVAEWQTRTGVMVDHGIVLDTGGGKPVTIPFQLCTPSGCQAVANLAPDFVDALTKASKATATIFPIGSKGIILTISTKGLPDALGALKTP